MNVFEGIFLGFLQGITEWLPISSSGQSMLFLINLFNIPPEEAFSISIMLHLGSLIAVLFYFREKVKNLFTSDKRLLLFLLLASVSSTVVGLPLYLGLRDLFTSISGEAVTMIIGVMLILTGIILRNTEKEGRDGYNRFDAIITGGAQGVAVLPGISRSGTTIAALLIRGVEQETALSLSFLLAIPAIMGLAILDTMETGLATITLPLLAGIITSFLVSLATMHYFLILAKKVDFSGFVIVVGSLTFFIPLGLILIEWVSMI
jgi:undecaprenyl-diphosphatase